VIYGSFYEVSTLGLSIHLLVSFPFIGLGIGTYIGMWLKEHEINGIDLGIIPTLAGFVFSAWVTYKIFFGEDGSDLSGKDWD
jgi:hypothetical protein